MKRLQDNNKKEDNGIVMQNAPSISDPRADTNFDTCLCASPQPMQSVGFSSSLWRIVARRCMPFIFST